MKATLIVIENEKDHVQAKALVEGLMRSENVADRARMVAQARLIEAYERSRWPRRRPALKKNQNLVPGRGVELAEFSQ